jgi:F0F1-type ATP synthase assembly protein I
MAVDGSDQPPSKKDASTLQALASLAGIGFEFLAAVLLPGALGWWLDQKFGSAPWIMLSGGVFGFAAGLYLMLRAANRAMK